MPSTICLASEMRFCDEEFTPARCTTCYRDDHFEQRRVETAGTITCETVTSVRCTVDAAVALVRSPWTWWEHGRVTGVRQLDDGSQLQVISPVWWYLIRIELRVFPPMPLFDFDGVRVPILMARHFVGPATMDIYRRPDMLEQTILRGRYHRVECHVPIAPRALVERIHLSWEAGRGHFPFPKGTGWVELRRRLEATGTPASV